MSFNDTCSINKNIWFYKIAGLILLVILLIGSAYFYYKSLSNIKHKELSSL